MRKSQALKLYLELEKNLESFASEIKKRGFIKFGEGSYKVTYSKNKLNYVIKLCSSVNDEFSHVPQLIKNFYIPPYFCDEQIVIQQKANTNKVIAQRAYFKIKQKIGIPACESLDINCRNCGEINKKPVVFDFCELRGFDEVDERCLENMKKKDLTRRRS